MYDRKECAVGEKEWGGIGNWGRGRVGYGRREEAWLGGRGRVG